MGSLKHEEVLSHDQVDYFMVQRLKFSSWKSELAQDRLQFLVKTYQKYITAIPFQNLTRFIRPESEFNAPTKAEIIRDVMSGVGGGCTTLNYFFYVLLKELGYNAFTVPGTFSRTEFPNTHLIAIVDLSKNNSNGELYFCDVGSTGTLPEPIKIEPGMKYVRLDADDIGYEYKETEDKGVFALSAVNGSIYGKQFPEHDKTELKFTHKLVAKEYEENNVYTKHSYVDPKNALLQFPFLIRYLELNNDQQKYVAVAGRSLVLYDSKNSDSEARKITKFQNSTERKAAILDYFPMISGNVVDEAMVFFNRNKEANIPIEMLTGNEEDKKSLNG